MYNKILVTLGCTPTDRAIIEHIKQLAKMAKSRVVLLHVADGWAARFFGPDAVSPEVKQDMEYLEKIKTEFLSENIQAEVELAYGEPASQITKWVQSETCDLIAMSTHGHKFFSDLFLGTTASHVRHNITIPVLLLKGK